MTPEQAAAFVNAQAACALMERAAMTWQNNSDNVARKPLTYGAKDFMALQDKYCISHNAVLQCFQDANR